MRAKAGRVTATLKSAQCQEWQLILMPIAFALGRVRGRKGPLEAILAQLNATF